MIVPDSMTIALTLVACFFITLYYIYDLYANRKAYDSLREFLFRILIPIVIGGVWNLTFWFVGYNPLCNLIFFAFAINTVLVIILIDSEGFLGTIMQLDKIGRTDLYLHWYNKETWKMEVNVYQFKEEGTTLEALIQVVEDNQLFQKERNQFEDDQEWNKYLLAKSNYEAFKKIAKNYNLDVYAFYHFGGEDVRLRGFYKLYHINKLGILKKKIEGNCVLLPDKKKIHERNFQFIVCWEGFKDNTVSQELEITKSILSILTYVTDLEELPLLRQQIKKKDLILAKHRKAIDDMEDDFYINEVTGEPASTQDEPPKQLQWLKMVFVGMLAMMGSVILLIFLLFFGLI